MSDFACRSHGPIIPHMRGPCYCQLTSGSCRLWDLTNCLRRAEVAGLDVTAYDRQAERLTVTGKRNKTRAIPIEDPGARGALADWLHLRGLKPGAMFARIDRVAGGGHAIARDPESGQPLGLTDQAICYILDER